MANDDRRKGKDLPRRRTYDTLVDRHYRVHQTLPRPTTAHREISVSVGGSVLVIGDVHGCLDELLELVDEAVEQNGGVEFEYVVLVGDLVNKGPSSAKVVWHVRETKGWLCVRGNHDDGALLAALGNERTKSKRRYEWVKDLSDDDVFWLSELPYTIRICFENEGGTHGSAVEGKDSRAFVVVHAGLVPGIELENQTIRDMITLRNVVVREKTEGILSENDPQLPQEETDRRLVAWACEWKGPGHAIFGHDARRGLQLHEHATGLDTGCCYGKELTGIILPPRRLLQVKARRVYCPPGVKED
jgi:hypothetical protein